MFTLFVYIYACICYGGVYCLISFISFWKCFFFTIIECGPLSPDVRSSPVTRSSLSPSPTTPSTCWLRAGRQTSSWFISSGRKEKLSRAPKREAASQKFPSIQRITILSALWAEGYFECVVSLKVRGNYCQIER